METYTRGVFVRLVILAFFFSLITCGGGSSSSSSSDDSTTITITGTMMEPTSTSENLSAATKGKNIRRAVDDSAAVEGTLVDILTMEGETAGTGTVEADGTYSIEVDVEILKGSEDTSADFNEDIIIISENGTQSLKEVESLSSGQNPGSMS